MGTGYTRQSAADIQAGLEIQAGPLNSEFNQLRDAFDAVIGHAHDGTSGEGPKLFPDVSLDYSNGLLPDADGTRDLGSGTLQWNRLFLDNLINFGNGDVLITYTANALTFTGVTSGYSFDDDILLPTSGSVINFNAGDVTITHAANTLTFAGATTGYKFGDGPITPVTSDGTALGTSALMFSDLFLASGAVINFDAGDVTVTHAANTLTFAGASSGYKFDGGNITPVTSDTVALGTSTLMFSDLFLAEGGVINWDNGQITITQAADLLTIGGSSNIGLIIKGSTYPTADAIYNLGAAGQAWNGLYLSSAGVINFNSSDVTITHAANTLAFAGATTGYTFANGPVAPTSNLQNLGSSSFGWQDLYLAANAEILFGSTTVLRHSNSTPGLAVAGGNTLAPFSIESTNADGTQEAAVIFERDSASAAANDYLLSLWFQGKNDGGTGANYASIRPTSTTITAGTEEGKLEFGVVAAGDESVYQLALTSSALTFTGIDMEVNGGSLNFVTSGSGGDIAGLVGGSTSYGLIQGPQSAHLVVGLRDNDTGDSFSIVSGSGNWNTDTTFDRLVAQFSANGDVTVPGVLSSTNVVLVTNFRSADNMTVSGVLTTTGTNSMAYDNNGTFAVAASASAPIRANRLTSDGNVYDVYQAGTLEGGVSVSGTTVAIAAATIAHWTQLADHSKPDIKLGTILESIDQTCEWFGGYTDDERFIELPPSYKDQVGQVVTYNGDTITVVKQKKDYLAMGKVSDTLKSKKVLGVFMHWDNDYEEGNDIVYAGGGTYKIRIAAGQTPVTGDYIQSDGNGCGIVQDDDILRASTVAKITANEVLKTYDDGSFLMPCFVVCG